MSEDKLGLDGENEENPSSAQSQNDDFVIGEGFVINEISEEEQPVLSESFDYDDIYEDKKASRRSVKKTVIWVVCIVVIAVTLAFGVIFVGADYLGIGFGRGKNVAMEIPKGASTQTIAAKLKESGAVKCPLLFRVYSKLKHFDGKYKYGLYTFDNEAGYASLAQMLMTDGAKADSVKVTVPEGSTVDDIADLLEKNGVCSKADFIDAVQNGSYNYDFVSKIPTDKVYYRLEGYLFPDTYNFYSYDSKECAHLAVDTMLSNLNSKLDKDMLEKIDKSKYSFHEIMTMASIVELEAGGSKEEMSNVAAVFFNRLESDNFDTLGSSPTRKYPYGNGRYDTYVSKGLPPGPLCSASVASIKGTLNPTQNFDYYYFVTDAKMKFYYNKTLSQHNATIAKLKAAKNWIYEE